MKSKEDLEKKISELEYRLSVLEKFLDYPGPLFHKDDESLINSIRMDVIHKMDKQGYHTEELKERLGTGFYKKS